MFKSAMHRVGLAPNQYRNQRAELLDLAEVPGKEPVARPAAAVMEDVSTQGWQGE